MLFSLSHKIDVRAHLWQHDEAEGQDEQNHVYPVHPPQEEEIGGHRGAKLTCDRENTKLKSGTQNQVKQELHPLALQDK